MSSSSSSSSSSTTSYSSNNDNKFFERISNEDITITTIIDEICKILNIKDKKIINLASDLSNNDKSSGDNNDSSSSYGKILVAMKSIVHSSIVNDYRFNQSQLYDELTILSENIDDKNSRTSNITFSIYKDIMENYQQYDDDDKLIFPKIIVDIMYILHKGTDSNGNKVNPYQTTQFYQKSKLEGKNQLPDLRKYKIEDKAEEEAVRAEPNININEDFIDILVKITDRDKNLVSNALTKLQETDLKKINDLCTNYPKLEKYSKLIGKPEFKATLEKEIERTLSDSQMQHASNSIKKTKIYIESILDGKFAPSGKNKINHIRHNLEYGYQLMGLIQVKKRKSAAAPTVAAAAAATTTPGATTSNKKKEIIEEQK